MACSSHALISKYSMKLLQFCLALALAATFSSCTVYDHGGYSSQGYSRGSGYSPFTDRGYDDRLRHSYLRRNAYYDDHDRHDHHDHSDYRDDHRSSSSAKKSSSSSNRSSSSSNRSSGGGSGSSKKSSSSSSSKKSSSGNGSKKSSSSGGGGGSKKSSSSSSGSSRGVKDSPRNTPPRLR